MGLAPAEQQVGTPDTPDSLKRKRRIAEAMMEQGMSTAPVGHWTQAIARVIQGGMGGWLDRKAADEEKASQTANMALLAKVLGGGDTSAPPAATAAAPVAGGGTTAAAPPDYNTGGKVPTFVASKGGTNGPSPEMAEQFTKLEQEKGLPPGYLSRTIGIESNFNPNAFNKGSKASGLGQFVPGTARQYGLTDPFDPNASIDATARLAADNKAALARALGREPTAGELYLAHQQGAGGASKLLRDPDGLAVNTVGRAAVVSNGGNPNMTNREFAGLWTNRFDGGQRSVPTLAQGSPMAAGAGSVAASSPWPEQPPTAMAGGNVPAFNSGLTPEQDAQNAQAQARGTMPAAPVSRIARALGGAPQPQRGSTPVAYDQATGGAATPEVGSPAYFKSIVDNPRSPAPQREWAMGELAKLGGGQQPPQAQQSNYNPATQQPSVVKDYDGSPGGYTPVQQPTATPPGYTPEQVAAAQAAAAQGQQRYAQANGPAVKADQIAPGAQQTEGAFYVPGTGMVPAGTNANNPGLAGQSAPQQQPGSSLPQQITPQAPSAPVAQAQEAVAQATPAQRKNVSPALIQALLSPWTPPGMQTVLGALLQRQLEGEKVQYITGKDGTVYAADPRGNIKPVFKMPQDPVEAEKAQVELQKSKKELNKPNIKVERDPDTGEWVEIDMDHPEAGVKTLRPGTGSKAPTTHVIKQDNGSEVAVQWDPKAKQWIPLQAPEGGNAVRPTGGKLTESQSKDLGYYNRGQQALEALGSGDALASGEERTKGAVPLAGNYLTSEQYQMAQQAGQNFLTSILRKDSGAAIGHEEEARYGRIFLPQPGDKPGTLKLKAEARQQALQGIRDGLGTAEVLALGEKYVHGSPGGSTGGNANRPAGTAKNGMKWSVE